MSTVTGNPAHFTPVVLDRRDTTVRDVYAELRRESLRVVVVDGPVLPMAPGAKLRAFRKAAGWTLARTADALGVSPATVQVWETDARMGARAADALRFMRSRWE